MSLFSSSSASTAKTTAAITFSDVGAAPVVSVAQSDFEEQRAQRPSTPGKTAAGTEFAAFSFWAEITTIPDSETLATSSTDTATAAIASGASDSASGAGAVAASTGFTTNSEPSYRDSCSCSSRLSLTPVARDVSPSRSLASNSSASNKSSSRAGSPTILRGIIQHYSLFNPHNQNNTHNPNPNPPTKKVISRRSVISMKSLMPLALPSTTANQPPNPFNSTSTTPTSTVTTASTTMYASTAATVSTPAISSVESEAAQPFSRTQPREPPSPDSPDPFMIDNESKDDEPNEEPLMSGLDLCNLPEMLARDLELSSDLFASRNLTAGLPDTRVRTGTFAKPQPIVPSLVLNYSLNRPEHAPNQSDSHDWSTTGGNTGDSDNVSPVSENLGSINKPDESSPGSEGAKASAGRADVSNDAVSVLSSGSGRSVGAEPPYVHQSVVTTATSTTSEQCPTSNRPTPPSPDRSIWIDDSDNEMPPELPRRSESRQDGVSERKQISNSPVMPTIPFTNPFEAGSRIATARASRPSFRVNSRPASRSTSQAPSLEGRPLSRQGIEIPKRRSSLSHRMSGDMTPQQRYVMAPPYNRDEDDPLSPISPVSRTPSRGPSLRTPTTAEFPRKPLPPIPIGTPKPEERQSQGRLQRRKRTERWDFSRQSFEASPKRLGTASNRHQRSEAPRVNIQTWLESSVPSHARSLSDEYPALRAGAVPLPPEVLDTLRISIACFPETMLLTGSLSIDTIRSYSHKFKRPTTNRTMSDMSKTTSHVSSQSLPSQASSQASKRWLWSRVLSPATKRSSSQIQASELTTEPRSPTEAVRPSWLAMKNVFGSLASDYLCDALYAHVIAYNYISVVLARLSVLAPQQLAPPIPVARPVSSRGNPRLRKYPSSIFSDDDNLLGLEPDSASTNEIPRKAASLLGLADRYDPTDPLSNTRISMRTQERKSSIAVLRETLMSNSTTRERERDLPSEGVIKMLQLGLGKCIARLVTTLRSGQDGVGAALLMEDVVEVDALFMRSLCEIVRCCEDGQAT